MAKLPALPLALILFVDHSMGVLYTNSITITFFTQDLNFLVSSLRTCVPINRVYCVLSKQFIYRPLNPTSLQTKSDAQ